MIKSLWFQITQFFVKWPAIDSWAYKFWAFIGDMKAKGFKLLGLSFPTEFNEIEFMVPPEKGKQRFNHLDVPIEAKTDLEIFDENVRNFTKAFKNFGYDLTKDMPESEELERILKGE